MGDSFVSKSFLFEVVDTATEKIEESFTLVLPPQSYSVKEKQRINITKTFGNAFIDDYGADNIELTIKGISGTAHAFPTFQTKQATKSLGFFNFTTSNVIVRDTAISKATEGYTHKSAFYYFRDKIMRYKDKKEFDKKELRVYDLADEQAYKCILLEFSVDRVAEKPFHYPFTISLFVYDKIGEGSISKAKKITISKNPALALANLLGAITAFKRDFAVFQAIQSIRNSVATLSNFAELYAAQVSTIITQAADIAVSPLTMAKQLIDSVVQVSKTVYTAYVQGKMTFDMWTNAGENIKSQLREALAMYGFSIESGSQSSKTEQLETSDGIDYDGDAPAPRSISSTFTFSGLNEYTVLGDETLQEIAQNVLGDDTLWPFIASVNENITSNDDITAGMVIYVPIPSDSVNDTKDSFILTEDTMRDPYGADIRLDSNGDMVLLESNDVALISGVDNILQSVDVRLKTDVGSLLKQTAFGLISGIGMAGTSAAVSYVRMNIRNALMSDPRVLDVFDVKVGLDSDQMKVSASMVLVGANATIPVSVLL